MGFIKQSSQAYVSCYNYACSLANALYMPLVYIYYNVDKNVSSYYDYSYVDGEYNVFLQDKLMARAQKIDGHYDCSCSQENDLGTVCPHVLPIGDVKAEEYTHNMWLLDTFRGASNVLYDLSLPKSFISKARLTTNQQEIISAVRSTQLSDEMTKKYSIS